MTDDLKEELRGARELIAWSAVTEIMRTSNPEDVPMKVGEWYAQDLEKREAHPRMEMCPTCNNLVTPIIVSQICPRCQVDL